MERSQRIGLLVAAAVVAVVAVILISGGDDDDSDNGSAAQTTTTAAPGKPSTPSEPAVTTVTIKDGQPVGGVQEIEIDKGDTLQFRVKSDEEHEIHLHGYDVEKEVAAGGQVNFKLTADIDGLFEAEIEDLKEQILEIRVNP
jgi:plastocyanin